MDLDEFRAVLTETGADLWALIDTAIAVAAREHREELKAKRDGIVERLYSGTSLGTREGDGKGNGRVRPKESDSFERGDGGGGGGSPSTPQSVSPVDEEEVEDFDEESRSFGRSIDDEKMKILAIKEHLEDPDQDDETLVSLLQNLADMDITFKALQETDIGRHVNRLRKHPSGEVRGLVKVVVRKWKELVDNWVKLSSNEPATSAFNTDGDSPQQNTGKTSHSGNHVSEFGYSPNPHTGSSGSDRNNNNMEQVPRARSVAAPPRREPTPTKQSYPTPPSAPPKSKEPQKDSSLLDPERLASARRRLHENYQEAQNAKKQRTIQVMDIHDIPKPKNSFFPRNKQGARNR